MEEIPAGSGIGRRNIELKPALLRIAILGAESSGKSTLAEALAQRYRTLWIPEYLREFVDTTGRTPEPHEQILIARTQIARELAAAADARAKDYLFCDTTPVMTAIYSRYCFGSVDAPLAALARAHRYELTLVAAPDCPWEADGLQRVSDAVRQDIHREVLATLDDMETPYVLIAGALEERIRQVATLLTPRA